MAAEQEHFSVTLSPPSPREGAEPGTLQVRNAAHEVGVDIHNLLSMTAGLFLKFKSSMGLYPPTLHPEK